MPSILERKVGKSIELNYDNLENGVSSSILRSRRPSRIFFRCSSLTWLTLSILAMQMLTILYLLKLRLPILQDIFSHEMLVHNKAAQIIASSYETSQSNMVHFVNVEEAKNLKNLIIVPGHAITTDSSMWNLSEYDEAWYLLDYQLNHDVGITLVDHIKQAVELCMKDSSSLLIFSGGQTRSVAGPKSEGFSYFSVAEAHGWWGKASVRGRAASEEYAQDSFQNLLFSIARFHEITGNYPQHITIVGYDFKRDRFMEQHVPALRLPSEKVSYVGLVPKGSRFNIKEARDGEFQNSVVHFVADPYGCADSTLLSKRSSRNPYMRFPPYSLSVPDMAGILNWCEPSIYKGHLPWD